MLLLLLDGEGRIQDAAGDALHSFGYAAGDVMGREAAEVFASWPELRRGIDDALADRYATARVRADGHVLELQFAPRRNGEGVKGVLVGGLDTDELEQGQQRRRGHDRHMRLIFRQVPGAIWATDRELRITYALGNPPKSAGFDVENIVGTSVYEIVGTRDPAHPAIANHLAALAGQDARFQLAFRGSWFEVLVRPLRDSRGEIVGCVAAGVDQTQRCRAERELARSKTRLAEAQRVARVGSFEWEVETGHLRWSDDVAKIFDLDEDELVDSIDILFTRVHPDDVGEVKTRVFDAVREGKPFECEVRIVAKSEAIRVFHARSAIVRDSEGRPSRVVATFHDVTDARATTRALEELVSLLRATLDSTEEGVLVVDRAGKIVVYNQRFLDLWRIPSEVASRGDDDLLLDRVRGQLEDPDVFFDEVKRLYAHPEDESFDTLHFRDGRVYERCSHPQWIGDEIVGRVWCFRDVTEHQRLLRRSTMLADAARLFASLDVERALEAVAKLTIPRLGDACAVDLLDQAGPRRLVEVSREGVHGVAGDPHPAVLEGHASLYRVEGVHLLGVPLISTRGLVGVITLVSSPHRTYDEDDLALAEELGRQAALAIESARAYREVQEALEARDEFLSIASHEIRGPLTAMNLAVQTLQEQTLSKERLPAVMEIIQRENRRLTRLADDLLDVGRIRAGNLRFEFEEVDLGEVIREASTRLRADITQSKSSLSISTGGNLVGHWDRFRLEQVVTNLLSNAIKFGQGNPVEVHARGEEERVVLVIRDQGIGIPPGRLEQIFRPFDRAVSSRHYGGLGLGLYIVRTIVEGFGGSVRAESPEGGGARFVVDLPKERRR